MKARYFIFRPPEFYQTKQELEAWFAILLEKERRKGSSAHSHASISVLKELEAAIHGSSSEIKDVLSEVRFEYRHSLVEMEVEGAFPLEALSSLQAIAVRLDLEFLPPVIPHKGV